MGIESCGIPAVAHARASIDRYRAKIESGIGQPQKLAEIGGGSYLIPCIPAHGGPIREQTRPRARRAIDTCFARERSLLLQELLHVSVLRYSAGEGCARPPRPSETPLQMSSQSASVRQR